MRCPVVHYVADQDAAIGVFRDDALPVIGMKRYSLDDYS